MATYVENFASVFPESGDDVYAKPVVSGNVVLSPWTDDSVAALEIGTTNVYAITLDETKAYVAYLNLTTQTFTADAGTDVITATAHGLLAGETIRFKGTDLPAGIVQSTLYYIISPAVNTFQISATPGGAAVDITDAGSGTMVFNAPSKRTSTDLVIGTFSIIREALLTPEGEEALVDAIFDELVAPHAISGSAGDILTSLSSTLSNVNSGVASLLVNIGTNGSGLTAIPWNPSWSDDIELMQNTDSRSLYAYIGSTESVTIECIQDISALTLAVVFEAIGNTTDVATVTNANITKSTVYATFALPAAATTVERTLAVSVRNVITSATVGVALLFVTYSPN